MADTEVTNTESADAAAAAADIEQRARLMGWKDKSEFDRPPERWVDAATFVERGETVLPVLKQNLRQMEEKLNTVSTQLTQRDAAYTDLKAELAANSSALQHLRDLSVTAETRAFERAKAEVERERRNATARLDAATSVADTAAARVAAQDLASLRDPEPPKLVPEVKKPAAPAAATVDAAEQSAVDTFIAAESSWFKKDPEATSYAGSLYGTLQQQKPGMSPAERLAEVKRSVTKRFPELFQNTAREAPPMVATPSGGTSTRPRAKGWTFDDLPQDVRAVADKTVDDINKGNKGKKYTRQDYVDMYFKGQERAA